jgi:dUTP pyrophosphatase
MSNSISINYKKLHKKMVEPNYAHEGDACVDLVAVDMTIVYHEDHYFYEPNSTNEGDVDYKPPVKRGAIKYIEYELGFAAEIPDGYVGLCLPRSSISNYDLVLCNSMGVIDAPYRGTWKMRFKPVCSDPYMTPKNFYRIGDKVGQLMVIPRTFLYFIEVNKLNETQRGSGGFGSSGK